MEDEDTDLVLHDVRYPNLNKIPTFSQNARMPAITVKKGKDFFLHRLPFL